MTNEIHRHKEKEAHICRNRVFRVLDALGCLSLTALD